MIKLCMSPHNCQIPVLLKAFSCWYGLYANKASRYLVLLHWNIVCNHMECVKGDILVQFMSNMSSRRHDSLALHIRHTNRIATVAVRFFHAFKVGLKCKAISKKKDIPKKHLYFSPSLKGKMNMNVLFLVHIPLQQYMLTVALWINKQILIKLHAKSVFSDSFKKCCCFL